AAAAGGLHVDLLRLRVPGGGEEDRLHVLAADLGDEAHVGMLLLDARGDGDHFLDHLAAHERGDESGAGAGEEHAIAPGDEPGFGLHPAEELVDLLGLLGIVPFVVLPRHPAVPDHDRFDCRRAYVDADELHAATFRPILAATCKIKRAAVPAAPA